MEGYAKEDGCKGREGGKGGGGGKTPIALLYIFSFILSGVWSTEKELGGGGARVAGEEGGGGGKKGRWDFRDVLSSILLIFLQTDTQR